MENNNKKSFGQIVSNFSMPILLLLLMLVFSLLSDRFLTPLNLTNILVQNVHIAICATGVFMIMVSGGCDLSIGYQMSVAAVLVAKLLSSGAMGVVPAILLGILICVALGCFNGVMSIALNSQPMIVTLGTMAIFQGISYLISGSKTYHNLPRSFMYLGQGKIFGKIPLNAVIALVIIVIVGIILSRTHIGRKIYAVGDNPEAAKLAEAWIGRNGPALAALTFRAEKLDKLKFDQLLEGLYAAAGLRAKAGGSQRDRALELTELTEKLRSMRKYNVSPGLCMGLLLSTVEN